VFIQRECNENFLSGVPIQRASLNALAHLPDIQIQFIPGRHALL